MEERSTTSTISGEDYYGLPDRFVQMRHFSLAQGSRDRDLEYMTPERFDLEMNRMWGGGGGRPRNYTLIGDEVRLGPCPNDVYTIQMVFYQTFIPLSDTITSNWLLVNAPDVLLYGALLEATPFLKDLEAAKGWGLYFNEAISAIQSADSRDRHSGGALRVIADHQGY